VRCSVLFRNAQEVYKARTLGVYLHYFSIHL
jgi:hypothetical protein